jgi:NADH-quinone oxidoreductase subunit N
MDGSLPQVSWGALLPLLLITGTGLLVLVLDPLMSPERRDRLPVLSLAGVVCAALVLVWRWDQSEIVFGGMLAADGFALFFNLLFLLVAGLTLLISIAYIRRTGLEHGEYSALLLFSTLGMMIMASSLDLMTIFLGLEALSISLYILAGFLRDQIRSNESALKYLLLGAFASGFVLYGIALVYGATGTINLTRVARALALGQVHDPTLLTIGMGLLIVGFGFKVAAVPFHMWAPDVYEGAPTSVTAFMIAGTKAAAFAALLRILMTALPALQPDWSRALWVLAVATMTVGNVVAIAQTNIKRMLAYSSIAHAGYVLVALVTGTKLGSAAILFYLLAYALMNLGAFAVVVAAARREDERLTIDDYAGLGLTRPALYLAAKRLGLDLVAERQKWETYSE